MTFPTLWQTFKKELFNVYSAAIILSISFIYFSFSVLLLNYRLVGSSIFGNNSINYKFNLLFQLLIGSYSAFSFWDFFLLTVTSLLIGVNILMIYKTLKSLKTDGTKLSLTVGGSTVLGILVAGCSSCGFSVLSLLGLTGVLFFIPFKGGGLHLIVIALLIFSFLYSIKTYHNKIVCRIN